MIYVCMYAWVVLFMYTIYVFMYLFTFLSIYHLCIMYICMYLLSIYLPGIYLSVCLSINQLIYLFQSLQYPIGTVGDKLQFVSFQSWSLILRSHLR